jgi:hypothetical protein
LDNIVDSAHGEWAARPEHAHDLGLGHGQQLFEAHAGGGETMGSFVFHRDAPGLWGDPTADQLDNATNVQPRVWYGTIKSSSLNAVHT